MRNQAKSDGHLLPRLRRQDNDAALSRKVERIIADVELNAVSGATAGGDPAALRGLPVAGVRGGFGGAIRGTKPGTGL